MKSLIAAVFTVALALSSVFAEQPALDFVENVRGGQRIVSGWESEIGQHPHQIAIRMVNPLGTVSSCGGSIIHHEWAITAAHCTATRTTIVVRAGVVNLTRPEYIFETTQWYNHPNYIDALQWIVQPHDLSLLKLQRHLPFSANIQPIRLQSDADKNRNYAGVQMIASGWGRTWTDGAAPENLNWVYLAGVDNPTCHGFYGSIVIDSTICAGHYNVTSQSTCQGDSGGPLLVVEEDGINTLVGISSFVSGTGCHTVFPAGFCRPGHYHNWYTQVTGIDFQTWKPEIPEPSESESSESSESSETIDSSEESSGDYSLDTLML